MTRIIKVQSLTNSKLCSIYQIFTRPKEILKCKYLSYHKSQTIKTREEFEHKYKISVS